MTIKETLALATDNPDEFMVEVSRLISPRPWKHTKLSYRPASARAHRYSMHRCQCGLIWVDPSPCTIPPTLLGSPADIAERLTKDVGTSVVLLNAISEVHGVVYPDAIYEAGGHWMWFASRATPYERILCCLIAKGLVHE